MLDFTRWIELGADGDRLNNPFQIQLQKLSLVSLAQQCDVGTKTNK